MIATVIITALIAVAFVAIVVHEVRKKLHGKSACSCGGNCGACHGCGSSQKG